MSSISQDIQSSDYGVTVTSTAPRAAVITQPADGVSVRAFGNEILFKLTSDQSDGALVVGLAIVPAGNAVPMHVQDREDELFLIVDGTYRFWVNGSTTDVGSGALVFVPRGAPHRFQVIGEKTGRHWVVGSPGGFDRFFMECAEVFAAPGAPDFSRLAAINAEHGNRFV
jgi:mannose-6-phosphate isomerase-like protein (cupin superfamily)